jgi:uncharacterized protein involved in oxidation of intracellular sulfur
MKFLIVLNEAPYGSERTYNGLRLAGALTKTAGSEVRVFLLGDATVTGKSGQKVPEGFYNLSLMLNSMIRSKGQIGVCGSCMDARGIAATELAEGAHRSSMDELAQWTQWADKVLVF